MSMLLSMTGHGQSLRTDGNITVSVEIRTVNSRYAKVNIRCTDSYQSFEPRIEEIAKKTLRRGTIQINLKVDRHVKSGAVQINEELLAGYAAAIKKMDGDHAIQWESLIGLPGVIDEAGEQQQAIEEDWPFIKEAVVEALQALTEMRTSEGDSMEVDLLKNLAVIAEDLEAVEALAPSVVDQYQSRLTEKLNGLLSEVGAGIEPADIIKEVGVFSEKCDISEETVRLRTHLEQFRKIVSDPESQGRKLDFVTQEMFRETNTIGSKANDAQIAQHVVNMKTAIERIREMVQNVE